MALAIKNKIQKAGSYVVDKAELITSAGVKENLIGAFVHIQFYEDIESGSITGQCLLNDLVDISTLGPIIGQEYLRLKLKTNTSKESDESIYDFTENMLLVNSLKVSVPLASGNKMLLIDFSTSDVQKDQRTRINQSYTGSFSDIFKRIMRDHLNSKKKLYVEPSNGVKKIVVPYLSPFETISMMKRQAVTARDGSPTYMFFEDFKGYHFRSLSSMYVQPTSFTYEASVAGTKSIDSEQTLRGRDLKSAPAFDLATVISTNVGNIGDSAAGQRLGAFGSQLLSYDTYTRRHETTIYNYLDNFKFETHVQAGNGGDVTDFPFISETPIDENQTRISDFPARRYFAPNANFVDNDNNYTDRSVLHDEHGRFVYSATRPETWIQRRESQLYQLKKGISCTINTNGNTLVDCGDVVEFNMPATAAVKARDNEKYDFFYRGRFLVRRLVHNFDFGSQKHESTITLIKDSLMEELASVDESLETKPQDNDIVIEDFYSNEEEE